MKVITNEKKIAQRKKWAGILSPVAMVLLLGGLGLNIASLRTTSSGEVNQTYFYGTLLLLVLGFIFSNISSHLVNHWVKEPRADQTLAKALKGFDSKNYLFNYTTKAAHILLTPQRVYAITTKGQNGKIEVDGKKWKRPFSVGRLLRFFAEENFGNPTLEAQQNADAVFKMMDAVLPEGAGVVLEPLIVFTNPDAELVIHNTEIPVLKATKLKSYIREKSKGKAMERAYFSKLVEAFSGDQA